MKVRNKLKSGYKGEITNASDEYCPCRPCWHPHDCGYLNNQGKWIKDFQCVTLYNNGCPIHLINELPIPIHIIRSKGQHRKRGQIRTCLRCGQKVIIGKCNFMLYEAYINNE